MNSRLLAFAFGLALFTLGFLSAPAAADDTIYDVVSTYGADPTGLADTVGPFNDALAACRADRDANATPNSASVGGGVIWFQAGKYRFTAGVTDDVAGCSIRGAGQRATAFIFDVAGGDGNLITISEYGTTISDIGFENASPVATTNWTAGYAVVLNNASYGIVRDLYFKEVPGAVFVTNSSEARLENLYVAAPKGADVIHCETNVWGLRVDRVAVGFGADNAYTDTFVIGTGCHTLTISNSSVSGGSDALNPSGNRCIWVHHDGAPELAPELVPQFIVLNDFECDHSLAGAVFDRGSVIQSVNSFYGSTQGGNGVTFSETFRGNAQFTNNDIRGNHFHGILINGGRDINITGGVIGNNSVADPGACHGVTVANGVENFLITNTRNGNIRQPNADGPDTQGCCIFVYEQTDWFVIANNECGGNKYGGVHDGSLGLNKSVTGNIPQGHCLPQ